MAQPSGGALFTEKYWEHAAEVDAALQAQRAVVRATLPTGVTAWVITRYEEARAALNDPCLSHDLTLLTTVLRDRLAAAGQSTRLPSLFGPHMLFADPPAHGRLRALVADQFSDDRVRAWRPRIEQITTDVLAPLSRTAPVKLPVDLIAEFAFPLSMAILGDLLGVPAADRPVLRRWLARMMRDDEESVPASWELAGYLGELISQRRAEPGEDLLSALASVVVDGDRLTDQEAVGTTILIILGYEHLANLVGNTLRWLLEQPATWQRIALDPSGLPSVIAEVLRYDSPGRLASPRCTIAPVVYGGVTIPAGELVLVSVAAANRDPRCFTQADRLDWHREDREARQHLALGHGLHHCLGAGMTLMQAEVGVAGLARSFPQARLAVSGEQLRRQRSAVMNGFQALPALLLGSV